MAWGVGYEVHQTHKTGAGAVIGNAVGSGGGRAAATMLGFMGGAVLGDRIESPGATRIENVQRGEIRTLYENHTVAYDVVYDYAGTNASGTSDATSINASIG